MSGRMEVGLDGVPDRCPCVLYEGQLKSFASAPDIDRASIGNCRDNHVPWGKCYHDITHAVIVSAMYLHWIFFLCFDDRRCLCCSAGFVCDILCHSGRGVAFTIW